MSASSSSSSPCSSSPSIKRVVTTFLVSSERNNNVSSTLPSQSSNKEITGGKNSHVRLALFRRCPSMPTYPSHWAGISGSLEDDETPLQAAQRELYEETNAVTQPRDMTEEESGLFVDVPTPTKIIRVYPFAVALDESKQNFEELEMRGTEHDAMQFFTPGQLDGHEENGLKCVPALAKAFHHATRGRYLSSLPEEIQEWATDQENGAAFLAQRALELVARYPKLAEYVGILRPTMVPITNSMKSFQSKFNTATQSSILSSNREQELSDASQKVAQEVSESMQQDVKTCVDLSVSGLMELIQNHKQKHDQANKTKSKSISTPRPFVVATFSRSSTLLRILNQVRHNLQQGNLDSPDDTAVKLVVLCGQSTPGNEGELMARDLGWDGNAVVTATSQASHEDDAVVHCLTDEALKHRLRHGDQVDVLLVGADCVMVPPQSTEDRQSKPMNYDIVNKVGTTALASCAQQGAVSVPVYACADRWKLWYDAFPPPLEEDLFEVVPGKSVTKLLVPGLG